MVALRRIPSEYKKRWAIETGCRTESNSLSPRLLLLYFSMAALNVLAMYNYEADTERTRVGLLKRGRNRRGRRAAARARAVAARGKSGSAAAATS